MIAQLGEVGLSPGQFSYPRAMDTDGKSLWIVDKAARIQQIDPASGECLGGWTMPEFDLGKPTGITVAPGPEGNPLVWVADTHYHRVQAYPAEPRSDGAAPEPVLVFGAYGRGDGQFVYPTDVAVLTSPGGAADRIYVGEYGGNDRISVFDGRGTFLFSFGQFGSSDSPDQIEFNRPQAVVVDAARGELFVADACNHRIGRFTLDGRLVQWIGSADTPGDGPGQFRYPYGLSLLDDGTLLVAEFGNHRVQRIDPETGRGLGSYGAPGRAEGELATPWTVTAIGRTAYVLDSGNNRVLAFESPAPRTLGRELAGSGHERKGGPG